MKVILTGSTGFMGSQILQHCISSPAITSIIVLSRRPLSITSPKLKTIVMKDFLLYSDSVIQDLSGANACIWAMGTTACDPVLEIDCPLAFAAAFRKTLLGSSAEGKTKFRYVHMSGKVAEPNQEKSLWFLAEGRKIKGLAETKLKDVAEEENVWETYILRPAMVLSRNSLKGGVLRWVLGNSQIWVDELAAAAVDVGLKGSEKELLLNDDLVVKGRRVLNPNN